MVNKEFEELTKDFTEECKGSCPFWYPYVEPMEPLEELKEILSHLMVRRTGMSPGTCNNFNEDQARGYVKGVRLAIGLVRERIDVLEEQKMFKERMDKME